MPADPTPASAASTPSSGEPTAPSTGSKREHWSGQTAFILAAIGSAVGLGNIWRFPGEAYDNGGGAFMIPYLVALITAGIPILFLENAIGHRFRGSAPLAFRRISRRAEGVGWWHVAICFVIGLYYTVIIAWALSYFFFSFDLAWAGDPAGFFNDEFLQLGEVGVGLDFVPGVLIPLAAIWAVAIVVLALGVAHGVEKLNVIGIPLLVATFGVLVVRALMLDGAAQGVEALFTPDFSALTNPDVWIAAYGQVFFSLSLAYGVMLTYASYRERRSNLTGPALVVAFGNSSFSLLAGLGVFATLGFLAAREGVAVADLEGIAGVQLSFVTFPAVIAQMPGGQWFGALFFASLVIAGLTSLISVLQSVSSALQDKFGWTPRRGALTVGLTSATLSMLLFGTTTALYVLDVVDQWANQVGIVVGAVAMIAATLWFGRRGRELARHLTVLSSVKVGRVWLVVVNAVAVLLLYMLVDTTVRLATEGYDGYPGWFLVVFGWGAVAVLLVAALVMPLVRWKRGDDHEFVAWPTRAQLGVPERVGAATGAPPERDRAKDGGES
ncbi:sodium-dependent transporter [Demequina muriae]|uniref:Sodium-dependent transporter n=1 Tax=Demequina muriae TaxID=3051664 RepID=A0ABT8GDE6_9MICO|nr:sodium-dependent transporter [Demequina sp. EGI L300058]MDN4479445.1 sodium-dependent transporter [Demequina sp. EGI L300058]